MSVGARAPDEPRELFSLALLETLDLRGNQAPAGSIARREFATTGDATEFTRLGSRVLRRRIESVETVSLGDLAALPSEDLLDLLDAEEPTCA